MKRKIQVGFLNMMPDTMSYEALVRSALASHEDVMDLYPIRLVTHQYSDRTIPQGHYRSFAETLELVRLDLLIITGAPVEHLDYEQVSYWTELAQIIAQAGRRIRATAGICFGGLAIAKCLGIGKRLVEGKVFGMYRLKSMDPRCIYAGAPGSDVCMPFSTRALLDPVEVERQTMHGLRRVACSEGIDAVLETGDRRFLIVLGHPEYEVATLRQEWIRDTAKGIGYAGKFTEDYFEQIGAWMPNRDDSILAKWISSHIEEINTLRVVEGTSA
ncbi:homoserine O-acetyltransferase/O-succinyltransferase family protein [Dyella sp.]|uniref:homoserine O-acetyltransferase/O-succinyltransferase family protein n=1 Tax=Dyella sp. TaxID=1869338 RepID=UPI002B476E84|nr:homoserine O-succinyltransferase [Dyella sp.]HKT30253.1 homoserine O-succinyltransferase [Dyella sp.]